MDWEVKRQEILGEAMAIVDKAMAEGRAHLTSGESAAVAELRKKADGYLAKRKEQESDDELIRAVTDLLGPDGGGGKTWGRRVTGPWAKAYRAAQGAQGKALITPSGSVGVPSPLSVLAPLSDIPETMLQLIPTERSDSDAYAFLRETARTHNAAAVAASGGKPESVYTVERVDGTVQTIAHLSEPIPRSYLADAPLLEQYLDSVLREGLQLELEEQVIDGDGTAPDLEGILNTSGILTQAYSTDVLTTCRKALTALELYSVRPDGWVINPSDWETIELLTSANHYLMGAGQGQALPVDRARRRLWGVPVALSLGMTEGEAILADFAGSTQLWERDQTRVDWSENVYDAQAAKTDFERNLIRYRCEGRWGFAVTRPTGVCVVDLVAGS